MNDPLTTAYMAIGAARVIDQRPPRNWDKWSGELGFISDIIQHADALDQAGYEAGESIYHVVWCYEIAEDFGAHLATMMLKGEVFNAADEIKKIIQSVQFRG